MLQFFGLERVNSFHPKNATIMLIGNSSLYGSHPAVFITQQITLIQSNTKGIFLCKVFVLKCLRMT
jgi:ABC-type uncharacterized transport system substrate-binding protein